MLSPLLQHLGLLLAGCFGVAHTPADALHLIVNDHGSDRPLRFRTDPNGEPMSGSGAMAASDFAALAESVPPGYNVTVIDLRQESHGLLNGLPVSWWVDDNRANAGASLEAILRDERDKLAALTAQSGEAITVYHRRKQPGAPTALEPTSVVVQTVGDEAGEALRHNFSYVRLPMQDHTGAPEPQAVDALLNLIWTRPANQWWHFHCQAGKGRTSIFNTAVDIMKRASQKSLENIVAEHTANGAVNLLQTAETEPRRSKYAARIAFLQKFYQYARSPAARAHVLWSEWQ